MRNVFAVAVLFASTLSAQSAPCNRACLEGFVNQYLDALAAHNPFALPLSPQIKFSENDQLLEFGDGVWNVVTGIGNYKFYVADPQAGQVAFFGTLRENDMPVAFALRLKIENMRISEVESLVVRDGGAGAAVEALGKPDPLLLETAPAGSRLSRKALISAADTYWDAAETGNAANAPFADDCNRLQNGVQTTNNPKLNITPKLNWNPLALGCRDQINSKFFNFIQAVYPRRYLIVDEERQIVFGFFMVQVPGDITTVDSPGHGKIDILPQMTSPQNIDVAELYKFTAGKIRKVEALQVTLPYGTPSPFFKDDWRRPRKK